MKGDLVYAPGPKDDQFVELGQVGTGRIFKKMILRKGRDFVHPNDKTRKIKVDDALMDQIQKNFEAHVCDIVQVPVCNDSNQHTEDPMRNAGQVIDLEKSDDGLYAIIDARKPEVAEEMGKTILGASAMIHLNYEDTETGETKGPTLLHVAATNRPYITDLDGFEEIIAASHADQSDEDGPVLLSEYVEEPPAPAAPVEDPKEQETMTKEEMIAALKDEHGIDVAALTAAADKGPDTIELSAPAAKALGIEATTGITLNDVAAGVVELANTAASLTQTVDTLTKERDAMVLSAAEEKIDALVKEGRILPKQRNDMVALSMASPEMFERLLPEDSIVELSEKGVTTHDKREGGTEDQVNNYVELANSMRKISTKGKSRQ